MHHGLRPTYDAKALVNACAKLPMTFGPFLQNDAAEFLMLLADHLEDTLKGTSQASLIRSCFGGKLVQQVRAAYASQQPSKTRRPPHPSLPAVHPPPLSLSCPPSPSL